MKRKLGSGANATVYEVQRLDCSAAEPTMGAIATTGRNTIAERDNCFAMKLMRNSDDCEHEFTVQQMLCERQPESAVTDSDAFLQPMETVHCHVSKGNCGLITDTEGLIDELMTL